MAARRSPCTMSHSRVLTHLLIALFWLQPSPADQALHTMLEVCPAFVTSGEPSIFMDEAQQSALGLRPLASEADDPSAGSAFVYGAPDAPEWMLVTSNDPPICGGPLPTGVDLAEVTSRASEARWAPSEPRGGSPQWRWLDDERVTMSVHAGVDGINVVVFGPFE